MKLKNTLTYKKLFSFITIVLILTFIFNIKRNNTKTTFNMMDTNKIIQKDFNGDGKKDILYIKKENNNYYLQINTKDKSFQLDPSKNLKTLGTHYDFWPMRVNIKDLNRNNIPEILIQCSNKENPISHIFSYNKGNFENIFSSSNNILGLININNNQTPKILSGNYFNQNIFIKNHMLLDDKIIEFNYSYPKNFLGTELISNFIVFFTEEETDEIKGKIVSCSNENLINSIFQIKNNGYTFKFQDAFFEDIQCDNNGEINHLKWLLNFKGKKDNKYKNITLEIKLKKEKNKDNKIDIYKVYSFQRKFLKN